MTTPSNALPSTPVTPAPRVGAAVLLCAIIVTFLAASTAPTPLYRLYQAAWGFSPITLTFIFAIYALSLITALLVVGSLSDHLGRRPVILASLALEVVSILMFIRADTVSWLIAARLLQGFATGAVTSAIGAGLLDTLRTRGTLVNSVAPIIGMAVGALGTSILVQFAPAPMRLVYVVLLVLLVLQAMGIFFMKEVNLPKPGALASLVPRVQVPASARGAMALVGPIVVAVWALGGFFLSLGPSLARVVSGSDAPIIGGLAVFTLTTAGAAAVWLMRGLQAPHAIRVAAVILVLGILLTLTGVHTGSLTLFFVGTALAGLGFGTSFQGAVRTVLPLAAPHDRAGLLAAFYVMCYLGLSVPAVIGGVMAQELGLVPTMDYYGGAVALMAMVVLLGTFRAAPPRPVQA